MPRKPKGRANPSGKPGGKPAGGKRKRAWYLRPLRWLRYAVLLFAAASVAGVLLFRFVPVPFTPLMLIRLVEQRSEGKPMRLEKSWRSLDRISPHLPEAVVASEDQRFFQHRGFDWDAIGSAFTANGRGKRKLGASTISQQTAKNVFLWPDRTWLRKGLEAYFTALIETLWPKRRILEVYLNVIEMGDGVYGAEAAARRYFQVPASDLTAAQAALIAASLPNPRVWSPARPTGYLQRRQTWILRQVDHLPPLPWAAGENPRSPHARPQGSARDTSRLQEAPDGTSMLPVPGEPEARKPAPGEPTLKNPDPDEPVPEDSLPEGPLPGSPEPEAPLPPDSNPN
jgi:monofunctional biosynthetic peptidoglycan transglycosylase